MAHARSARISYVAAMVCSAVQAVVYRAYAIHPHNFRKTKFGYSFRNTPKTIFHVIRLCQLICLSTIYRATNCTAVGAYGIRPGLRGFRDVAAMVCGTVNAVVYRAYAIRPTISAKPNSAISSETRRKPYFTLYGFANLFDYPHYTEQQIAPPHAPTISAEIRQKKTTSGNKQIRSLF